MEGAAKAGVKLFEPIMDVEVVSPGDFVGNPQSGDARQRHGEPRPCAAPPRVTRHSHYGRDRGTARATLGKDLAVSAFPLYVPAFR
jgi:hypothetical protein